MLEQEVRSAMKDENAELSTILALVDDIQRLGLIFLFEEDVKRALRRYHSLDGGYKNRDQKTLHGTALFFRILRQNGFEVSPGNLTILKFYLIDKKLDCDRLILMGKNKQMFSGFSWTSKEHLWRASAVTLKGC